MKNFKKFLKLKNQKYKNRGRYIDGHYFRSQKEALYYTSLKMLKRAGEIKDFTLQPKFKFPCGITYIADFKIINNDNTSEIIDVKGFKTDIYKLKMKMYKHHHSNLKFREV